MASIGKNKAKRSKTGSYTNSRGVTYTASGGRSTSTGTGGSSGGNSFTQPSSGVGSVAETNRLLGGNYFDTNTGSQLKAFTQADAQKNTSNYSDYKAPNPDIGNQLGAIQTPATPSTPTAPTTPKYVNGKFDVTGLTPEQARSALTAEITRVQGELAKQQALEAKQKEPMIQEEETQDTKPYINPYEKEYSKLMNPSSEENDYQKQMSILEEQLRSFDTSLAGRNQDVAEQPVAQGFISGQQEAISNRAAIDRQQFLDKEKTLTERLALSQSKRQASLDAVKFNLERADTRQTRKEEEQERKRKQAYTESRDLADDTYRNKALESTIADREADNARLSEPKSTTSTVTERKAQKLGSYAKGFVAGQRMPDGTPILAPSGNITYVAWKDAIKDAVANGISRSDFIKQYGNMLFKGDLDGYGLTNTEKKLITGTGTSSREM